MRRVVASLMPAALVRVAAARRSRRAPGGARLPPRSRTGAAPPAGPARRGRSRDLAPVLVVEVPPPVGRGLRIALGRVLPLLLAPQRGDVEVGPGAAHGLVAAAVD